MIGTIALFAGNFAPRGWALCQGLILSIAQNTALFSILGTTYGGNGQTTFALPDLRGRSPISPGQGPGLSDVSLGEVAGTQNITLLNTNLPSHNHSLGCDNGGSSSRSPGGNIPGVSDDREQAVNIYSANAPSALMNPLAIGIAGSSQPFGSLNPYLGLNFIICTEGIYPSRN